MLHDDADKIEPRARRAVVRAAQRSRRALDLLKLITALENHDANGAMQVADAAIGDVWQPLGNILLDTRMKGHKRGRT